MPRPENIDEILGRMDSKTVDDVQGTQMQSVQEAFKTLILEIYDRSPVEASREISTCLTYLEIAKNFAIRNIAANT